MPTLSKEWKLSAVQQTFSLPEALIYYIAKNPLCPEVYNKLIRCCKYFWLKNPIIALHEIVGCRSPKDCTDFQQIFWPQFEHVHEQLWINYSLVINNIPNESLVSSIIPKIYRCDLTLLVLSSQMITFADFKFLVSSGFLEVLFLEQTVVKNNDGTIVPIEKLVENLPNLRDFQFVPVPGEDGRQAITSKTAAKLVAIRDFRRIKQFILREIPDTFDIDAFFATPKVSLINSHDFN